MKFWIPLFSIAFICACKAPVDSPNQESTPLTTLILLRHAEQDASQGEDPPLSEIGQQRADQLAKMLGTAGIDDLYATPYRRTMATAQPLAEALGKTIQSYDPDRDLRETATHFLEKHPGQTLLVVGHSSTVPGLVNALIGENRYESLAKSAFGDLFVVTIGDSSQAAVTLVKMP